MKNIHVVLAGALWFLAAASLAQTRGPKVDSLLHELETTSGDQTEILWGLAYELFDVDNPQALSYSRRAYEGALQNGDSLQIVKVGTTFGQLLRRMDKVDESIKTSTFLLPVSKRHNFRKHTKILLNSLALAYTFNEEYDKALEINFESLAMRKEDGINVEIGYSLNNIGLIYYKIDDNQLAIDYFLQSIEVYTHAKDSSQVASPIINIGFCYNNLNSFQHAISFLEKGLSISIEQSDQAGILSAEFGIGEAYCLAKECEAASQHLQQSLKLAFETNNQRYQLANLLYLAKVELLRNNPENSDLYLIRAESLPAMKEYARLKMEIYYQRASLYIKSREFEMAAHFLQKYIDLKDTIFSAEMNRKIRRVQTEFDQRKNVSKIEAQSRVLLLQKEAISNQRWLIFLSAMVAVLTGGLAIVLFKTNRRKSKVNVILDQRVRERTAELELQRDELRHTNIEQALAVKRVSGELIASLATWKGLSYAASRDLPQEQTIYFKQAEAAAEMIVNSVANFGHYAQAPVKIEKPPIRTRTGG